MGVAEGTFIDFLQRFKKAREAWDMGASTGKASIRRLQFMHAKKNPGAAIWLGKVYLGQHEVSQSQMGGIPGQPPVGIEHTAGRGISALVASARLEHEKKEAAKLIAGPPQDPAALPPPEREPILNPTEGPTAPEAPAATSPSAPSPPPAAREAPPPKEKAEREAPPPPPPPKAGAHAPPPFPHPAPQPPHPAAR